MIVKEYFKIRKNENCQNKEYKIDLQLAHNYILTTLSLSWWYYYTKNKIKIYLKMFINKLLIKFILQ